MDLSVHPWLKLHIEIGTERIQQFVCEPILILEIA
jgi:hypothetical protein